MHSPDIQKRYDALTASRTFARIAALHDLPHKRTLDMGCGYGEYMQRCQSDSVGITTTPTEVTYGREHNIDIRLGNVERLAEVLNPQTDNFDVFWGNNLFEHLVSPHAFLVNLKPFAKPDATLILGVPVVPFVPSLMRLRKFRGALASPHVNFFTLDTLRLTIEFAGWEVTDIRSYYLSSPTLDRATRRCAPHLYVCAKNNPEYTYPKKKLHEWSDDPVCSKLIETMHSSNSVTPHT